MRRNQAQIERVVLYQNRAQFVLNLGKLALFIRVLRCDRLHQTL